MENKGEKQLLLIATIIMALTSVINASLAFMDHELKRQEIIMYVFLGILLVFVLTLAWKAIEIFYLENKKVSKKENRSGKKNGEKNKRTEKK